MTKRAPLSFNVNKLAPTPAESTSEAGLTSNSQPVKQSKKTTQKTYREEKQFAACYLNKPAAKQLKLLGVQHEKTTQDLLIEAINDLFAKYDLSRIA